MLTIRRMAERNRSEAELGEAKSLIAGEQGARCIERRNIEQGIMI